MSITVTINAENAAQLWSELHGFLGCDPSGVTPAAEPAEIKTRRSRKDAEQATAETKRVEPEPVKKASVFDDEPAAVATGPTREDALQAAMKFGEANDEDALLAVLEQFGVEKFSALKPEQYGEFIAKLTN